MFKLFKPKILKSTSPSLTLLPGSKGEHFLQEKYGTKQRALRFYDKQVLNYLAPVMIEFIAQQEVLFISTADKHGECDCSFRFGKPGFVRVLNEKYLVYPEYRGNGVLASQGNILENPHIGMILVDFFDSTVGLHVNGKAKIVENEDLLCYQKELPADVVAEINTEGRFRPERWIMVEVEEAYIHCSKHVPLLKKVDKDIQWGTDDDVVKKSDFFALNQVPLYRRLGGEAAIQAIVDALVLKLLQDNQLCHIVSQISLQTLIDKQKLFLMAAFGGLDAAMTPIENWRDFFRQQTAPSIDDAGLNLVIKHLKDILVNLDVPEKDITELMASLV